MAWELWPQLMEINFFHMWVRLRVNSTCPNLVVAGALCITKFLSSETMANISQILGLLATFSKKMFDHCNEI